jgi:O-antigen ligase
MQMRTGGITHIEDTLPNVKSLLLYWFWLISLSVVIGLLNVSLEGNAEVVLVLLGGVLLVALSFLRPLYSFYLLVFLGMALEQFYGFGFDSWTFPLKYHENISNIHRSLKGVSITPFELHLIAITIGTIIHSIIFKSKRNPIIALQPMTVYAASLVAYLVVGLVNGGEFLAGLWEIRGILYVFILAAVIPQIVNSDREVKTIIWLLILGLTFRVTEVIVRFIEADFVLRDNGYGNHEDPAFIAVTLLFLVALHFFKVKDVQRTVLLILTSPFVVALIASDRRTVYAVLGAGLIAFLLMSPKHLQHQFLRFAWKAGVAFAVYLAVFWNSDAPIAAPARSIRLSFAGDVESLGAEELSNLYRKVEDYNLAMSYKDRLLGSGYGTTLDLRMPIPLEWDLGFYTPHNQILGILVKTGFVGFTLFFYFYFFLLIEIAKGVPSISEPYARSVLVFVVAGIINLIVYSFFDITLIWYRSNIHIGVLIGVASVILRLHSKDSNSAADIPPGKQPRPPHWILRREEGFAV